MKKRFLSAVLGALMACQLFAAFGTGASASGEWTPPLSIKEELPEGDLFKNGDFEKASVLRANWTANGQFLEQIKDENGAYLEMSNISNNYSGFDYWPSYFIHAGTYKFTGYIRTANKGELGLYQMHMYTIDGEMVDFYCQIYASNEWTKFEFYVVLENDLQYIRIRGGSFEECIQNFCVDHFSFVQIDPAELPETVVNTAGDNLGLTPEGYAAASFKSMEAYKSFRPYDPEYEKQFEVGGIIINHDNSHFLSQIANAQMTDADIINYAKQFEGTHVTDYMINVFSEGMTVYPSNIFEDYSERYLAKEIGGVAVDFSDVGMFKAAYELNEVQGTDYVGLWCETFPEIGINPWLSFRMNDVHELLTSLNANQPSVLVAEFYYTRPDLFRVRHREMRYTDVGLDYGLEEVRKLMLEAINDALNCYDAYGIELDYQREIRLFGIGDEYKGLDILNQFMRDVNDIVAIYEEKYGHDIKVGVRVASDIQTNYDHGLDVITWAHEKLINLVIPTGHFESTDYDTPVRTWSSLLSPLGIELAPCIEQNLKNGPSGPTTMTTTLSMRAGFAANAFSQGADKIAMFNYFIGPNTLTADLEKVNFNSDFIGGSRATWNLLTTIGSYDKLMTVNRRCFAGYNDTAPIWRDHYSQLPLEVKANTYTPIRIAVGDIPEGATVTFKISYNSKTLPEVLPTVYVNSALCKYIGDEPCKDVFTSNRLLCYEVPVSAYDGTYMLAEIFCKDYGFTAEHAEVFIKVSN